MLKIFCDICDSESNDKGFFCEMTLMTTGINLMDNTKTQNKKIIHICKKCYDKHYKKTIKI